jgi:S-adenosylmethionine decarboxylase
MVFVANEEGYEISAIFHGVSQNTIKNNKLLKEKSIEFLKKAGFTILGSSEHEFSPQGYTLVVLLAESHFAVHTYPEFSSIYFHLYSCGDKNREELFNSLKKALSPSKVEISKKPVKMTK